MKIATMAAAALAAIAALAAAGAAAQPTPTRGIEELKPGLFRAQNDQHYTVFLVTSAGIILSDPISTEFAQWLRGELDRRFDVPVRYVLYSHHHWDHASGGAVFADTAEFVGHEAMPAKLALPPASTPLPSAAAAPTPTATAVSSAAKPRVRWPTSLRCTTSTAMARSAVPRSSAVRSTRCIRPSGCSRTGRP